jgi:hypothetical protein
MYPILTYLTSRWAIAIYVMVLLISAAVVTGAVSINETEDSYSIAVSSPKIPFMQDTEPGEHQFFTSGLDSAEWDEETLNIHFNDDHGTDAFIIEYHAREPNIYDSPVVEASPRYGGTVEVDLRDIVSRNAPAGKYNIITLTGDLDLIEGDFSTYVEDTETITIQPDLKVVSAEFSDMGRLTLELRNEGNAPVHLVGIENMEDGSIASVNELIPIKGNTTITVVPFATQQSGGSNCYIAPSEVEIGFVTAPKIDQTVNLETGLDEGEEYCHRNIEL